MKDLHVMFATDFHGSEVCFRKLMNVSLSANADVIVMGGDLCGKGMVPIVQSNGEFTGELLGERFEVSTESEVQQVERNIRFNGLYPRRVTPDELEVLTNDRTRRDDAMREEMVKSVERWMEIGEEKLRDSDVPCVVIPGNDDDLAIDEALNGSTRVVNCDRRALHLEHVDVVGLGASNATPWHSPREFAEEELLSQLNAMKDSVDGDRPLVANIHVPPFRSSLDDAPMVDEDLRPVIKGGHLVVAPVGSTAVRQFIEEARPCLSLHGHIHECHRATRIGDTQAVNPGSDYSSGTLQAVLVTIDLKKRRTKRCQFVSG